MKGIEIMILHILCTFFVAIALMLANCRKSSDRNNAKQYVLWENVIA